MNFPIHPLSLALYYVAPILLLLIFYFVGHITLRLLFKKAYPISAFSILLCCITGLMTSITIWSLIVTKGYTVNLIVLLLFILFIWFKDKNSAQNDINQATYKSKIKTYLILIALLNLVMFSFFLIRITDFENGFCRPYFSDFNWYAKISQYMSLGFENKRFELNLVRDVTAQPYHYMELWVNVIMYKIFGLNALVTYTVSLPMLFNTLIFIALLAVVEIRKTLNLQYILFAFVALFMADILKYLPFIKGWMPLLESPKLLPIFLLLLFSYLLYKYDKKYSAYIILLSLPLFNVITIVSIYGTIGIILLFNTIKKRTINRSYWTPYLTVVFLSIIYQLHAETDVIEFTEKFHWGLFRLYFTQPIVYFISYIQILLLIFLLDKQMLIKTFNKIWIYMLIAFIISMTMSIFMRSYNYNATQFVTGIITVVVFLIVVVMFLNTMTSLKNLSKRNFIITTSFCILSVLIGIDNYKKTTRNQSWAYEYEQNIRMTIHDELKEGCRIGFWYDEYDTMEQTNKNYGCGEVDGITIPDVLDYYYNNIYHFSVNKSDDSFPVNPSISTPYKDYYKKLKAQRPDISDDMIRISFIRDNQIAYIRVFKNANPSDYMLANLELIAEDNLTGERFYKVKQ